MDAILGMFIGFGLTSLMLVPLVLQERRIAKEKLEQSEAMCTSLKVALNRVVAQQATLNDLALVVHIANEKWWIDLNTGARLNRNKGEMLMLIVTEIAEAMEGVRKDSMDDKLTSRKMEEVELADAVIRILDYAHGHGLDLAGAFREKMAYNAVRADHSLEARRLPGGKKI
jgi:NTP pyrophosphatase (non-canonical NTP hydrolase)